MVIYRVIHNLDAELANETEFSAYAEHFTSKREAGQYAKSIKKQFPEVQVNIIKLTLDKKSVCRELSGIPLFEFFDYEYNDKRFSHNQEA